MNIYLYLGFGFGIECYETESGNVYILIDVGCIRIQIPM